MNNSCALAFPKRQAANENKLWSNTSQRREEKIYEVGYRHRAHTWVYQFRLKELWTDRFVAVRLALANDIIEYVGIHTLIPCTRSHTSLIGLINHYAYVLCYAHRIACIAYFSHLRLVFGFLLSFALWLPFVVYVAGRQPPQANSSAIIAMATSIHVHNTNEVCFALFVRHTVQPPHASAKDQRQRRRRRRLRRRQLHTLFMQKIISKSLLL